MSASRPTVPAESDDGDEMSLKRAYEEQIKRTAVAERGREGERDADQTGACPRRRPQGTAR
jgi:hypothetical protein